MARQTLKKRSTGAKRWASVALEFQSRANRADRFSSLTTPFERRSCPERNRKKGRVNEEMAKKQANTGGPAGPGLNEKLLTRKQVADRRGVCVETIKRMEKRGELQAIRFNRKNVRYRLSDIERLEAQAIGAVFPGDGKAFGKPFRR